MLDFIELFFIGIRFNKEIIYVDFIGNFEFRHKFVHMR